jgi:hypothetical protein
MRNFRIVGAAFGVVIVGAFLIFGFTQKDKPPRVAILWPTNGAVVTGSIKVIVDAKDDGCISSLNLLVDGNHWWTLTEGPMVFTLPTDYFTNGVHTISAVAYDNAGIPYLGGNAHSDVVANEGKSRPTRVVFWNAVTVEWQPAFGTRLPIRASLAYLEADWTIHIKKEDWTELRKISGVSSNGKIDVVWDTKDERGNDVPADVVYFVSIETTPRGSNDVAGLANTNTVPTSYLNNAQTNAWCRPFSKSR